MVAELIVERTVMSPKGGGVNRRTYKFSPKCSGLNSLSAKPETSGFANPELPDLGKTASELRTSEFIQSRVNTIKLVRVNGYKFKPQI